jgi:peptidyl-prolyl cis-trans isomerase D
MLLSLIRKHAKSWLIKALIAIIAVVFIFYFGYSFKSGSGVKIAYVNGEVISGPEYQKAYRNLVEQLQREYKGLWNENLIKVFDLKNRAMETLINQKLVSREAKKIGLEVTEKEVQEKIMAYPPFQIRGRFDEGRYRSLLQNNRMKPEDFEALIAQELFQEKIQQFLMTFSPVTEKEVLDQYTYANRKVKISYALFQPDRYKASVKIDQSGVEKYFEEQKERYRIPERIKIAYVVFDPEVYKKDSKVDEEQIRDYYEENIDLFKEKKQVKAKHILFKLGETASQEEDAKVKEKALAVLQRAREGEDFSQLAKKFSEDPGTKENGDLGYFSAGQMVKPFESAAFALKKGEISDLVRTAFGYHIIKVEDIKEARTKTFEEVRDQIAQKLISIGASDEANDNALDFFDQMPSEISLAEYATEHKQKTTETDYFSQKDSIPGIGGDERLKQTLFSLREKEASEVMEVQGKFYIFQVTGRKPSVLPTFQEVSDRVKTDYTAHLAMQEAKAAAEQFLAKLKEGKDWTVLSKETHIETKTTEFFSRQDQLPEVDFEMREAASTLNQNKKYPDTVFESEKGAFVIRWEGQQGIDPKKYEEEKGNYRNMVARLKQQTAYKEWLDHLRKNAKIKMVEAIEGIDAGG